MSDIVVYCHADLSSPTVSLFRFGLSPIFSRDTVGGTKSV